MNIQTFSVRPVCSAVIGFLGVTMIAALFGLADEMGIIDTVVAKRIIGFAMGLMMVVIGNSLPKLRPLHSSRAEIPSTTSERLSGWTLVLAGSCWIALFAFAPLSQARYVAALVGFGAVSVIAVNWTWFARRAFFGMRREIEETAIPVAMAAGPRRIIGYLLFAFFFCVITACVKFFIVDKQLATQLTSWMLIVFCVLYGGLFAVLEYRHVRK